MLDRDLGQIMKGQADSDGVLVATRAESILDPIHISDEDDILPESFQRGLYPHWGILRRRGTGETFLLTERPFFGQAIDNFFYLLPSKLIEFYIGQSQVGQVSILDAGGGRDGTTAKDVASRYPQAQVINVDFVAVNERHNNFVSQKGDLCALDLPDESIDFAYSHQVLPFMNIGNNFEKQTKVVRDIFRVLKPGGTAVIDHTNGRSALVGRLKSIANEGLILPKRKSYGGGFLFIAKDPVDIAIMRTVAAVPSLAI